MQEYSASKALIITHMGVWNAGLVDRPLKMLKQAGIEVAVVNSVPPEPEIEQVQSIYNEAVKHNSAIIIGIGGGSAMDTAKLVFPRLLQLPREWMHLLMHWSVLFQRKLTPLVIP